MSEAKGEKVRFTMAGKAVGEVSEGVAYFVKVCSRQPLALAASCPHFNSPQRFDL